MLQPRTRRDFAAAKAFVGSSGVQGDPRTTWRKIAYTFRSEKSAQRTSQALKQLELPKDVHLEFFVDGPKLVIVGSSYALQQLRQADWASRTRKALRALPGTTVEFERTFGGVPMRYFRYSSIGNPHSELLQGLRKIPAAVRLGEDWHICFISPTAIVGPGVSLTSAATKP